MSQFVTSGPHKCDELEELLELDELLELLLELGEDEELEELDSPELDGPLPLDPDGPPPPDPDGVLAEPDVSLELLEECELLLELDEPEEDEEELLVEHELLLELDELDEEEEDELEPPMTEGGINHLIPK